MALSKVLNSAFAQAARITGLPCDVTLKDGRVVRALPGRATANDTILGTSEGINGDEFTLQFAAEDVQSLRNGDPLTWNGKPWRIKFTRFLGGGTQLKAFLVEA